MTVANGAYSKLPSHVISQLLIFQST